MNYETIIGIELHCELKTKTKMFSGAPVDFGKEPNTCVNEIDLAMPGTLPAVNKKAVELSLRACIATHCNIDTLVRFDRKNYYYSDLPKGFQITQQFHPIGSNGYVEIEAEEGTKKIGLNRIHMEEDTAKQFHQGDYSYIDYNRCGTPLIEVVSQPDMRSGLQAARYVEKIRNTLNYLGVCDGKMEEGSLRCDVNVSLRPVGSEKFGNKVEIKNLNSIANVQKAIEYEEHRQAEILDQGGVIEQATRRFDEASQTTVLMRKKEGNVDYKFFVEPNITPIRLDSKWIESIKENLPELPEAREKRYLENGLNEYDSRTLIANKELSDYFDEVTKYTKEYKIVCNYLLGDVAGLLNSKGIKIANSKLTATNLASLVNLLSAGKISSKQAKDIFPEVFEGANPEELVKKLGVSQISDESVILEIVKEVLDENEQSIIDFKNGKDKALGYIVGQVMKKSKGKANPAMAAKLVSSEIDKR